MSRVFEQDLGFGSRSKSMFPSNAACVVTSVRSMQSLSDPMAEATAQEEKTVTCGKSLNLKFASESHMVMHGQGGPSALMA